jgi:hypothetical protein
MMAPIYREPSVGVGPFAPMNTIVRLSEFAASAHNDEDLHRSLAWWNHRRLAPTAPSPRWREEMADDYQMRQLEAQMLEDLRREVAQRAAEAPDDPDGFIAWFEALKEDGPGQGDPLFPWLGEQAGLGEMRWFLRQEAAGEAGFDDLVALTQVKLPTAPKLELARNYWDEMGRGSEGGMHGPMLERTVRELDLNPTIDDTFWQSLALANVMTGLATNRAYAFHSLGALGAVELTAPGRVAQVAAGLKRLGVEPALRKYFQLHAVLDVEHSKQWNEEAIRPLVTEQPQTARAIAEGALMRLTCGTRCFDAYRAALWSPGQNWR